MQLFYALNIFFSAAVFEANGAGQLAFLVFLSGFVTLLKVDLFCSVCLFQQLVKTWWYNTNSSLSFCQKHTNIWILHVLLLHVSCFNLRSTRKILHVLNIFIKSYHQVNKKIINQFYPRAYINYTKTLN